MPTPMTLPFFEHPDAAVVKSIYHSLGREGHQLLIVGGAVRDWIRGEPPKDLDLVTTATPDELERIFPKTVPVGKVFGVMIVVEGEKSFEVATLRTEGRYLDGRHPEKVVWGTIDQDVHRRDFTINSIYYDPFKGVVYDLVGGLADLKDGILRTVGEPRRRFDEDHLRVLRAYRFRAQTGFTFDHQLKGALKESLPLLADVTGERKREELSRLFAAPHRGQVIEEMVNEGVFKILLPQVDLDFKAYREWQSEQTVRMIGLFRWLPVLYRETGKSAVQTFGELLKLSRDEKKALDEALIFWQQPGILEQLSLAELTLKLWSPHFRTGLEQYLHEFAPTPEIQTKVDEARRLKNRWGARTPPPWMSAKDFPELTGAALGERLKNEYHEQIVSEAANREEFLKWKTKAPAK